MTALTDERLAEICERSEHVRDNDEVAIAECLAEIERLRAEVAYLRLGDEDRWQQSTENVNTLRAENEQLRAGNRRTMFSLAEQRNAAMDESDTLRARVSWLEKQLATEVAVNADYPDVVEERDAFEKQLVNTRARVAELEEGVTQLIGSAGESRAECETLHARVAALEAALREILHPDNTIGRICTIARAALASADGGA